MALLELHSRTQERKYLEAASNGIRWANRFQILDTSSKMFGAYTGGRDMDKLKGQDFAWISSEHQADMLSLLYYAGKATGNNEYFARAKVVADWITSRAWDVREKRFRVGYAVDRLARIFHTLVEWEGGRGVRKLVMSELYDETLYRPSPDRL